MNEENSESAPRDLQESYAMTPGSNRTNSLRSYLSEWPKYVIEMMVIIISISASFWLERMNENRLNKKAQQNLLRNLATDLSSDSKSLENLIHLSQATVLKADTLLMLSNNVNDFASKKKFLGLFGSILGRPGFVAKNSTFFGAESTLRIEDTDLNIQLVDYYQRCDRVKGQQDDESARVLNIFQPYLYNSTSAKAWYSDDFESFATDGRPFKKYVNSDMFQNVILERKGDRERLAALYGECLALAKSLIAQLDSKITNDN